MQATYVTLLQGPSLREDGARTGDNVTVARSFVPELSCTLIVAELAGES